MSDLVSVPKATLQQALEALESLFTLQVDDARPKRCGDAITALRAALEQPEPDRPTIEQMMAVIGENQRLRAELKFGSAEPEQEPCNIAPDGVCETLDCCKERNA